MMKAVNDDGDDALEGGCDPGTEPDAPLSDDALLGLLDALVEGWCLARHQGPAGELPLPGAVGVPRVVPPVGGLLGECDIMS